MQQRAVVAREVSRGRAPLSLSPSLTHNKDHERRMSRRAGARARPKAAPRTRRRPEGAAALAVGGPAARRAVAVAAPATLLRRRAVKALAHAT